MIDEPGGTFIHILSVTQEPYHLPYRTYILALPKAMIPSNRVLLHGYSPVLIMGT